MDRLLSRLEGVKKQNGGYVAKCPAHEDKVQSLSVGMGDTGKLLLTCHAGCDTADVLGKIGLKYADLFPEAEPPRKPTIVTTYDYHDEQGEVLFQVVRYDPKDFKQRKPKPGGGWDWRMADVRRVPYRLPRLTEQIQKSGWVFLVEGEKDADNLAKLGFVATCIAGGADAWRDELAGYFADASVVIIPDNDQPGKKFAEAARKSLSGKARTVKVVELPDLPDKGDVTDFITRGGTAEDIKRFVMSPPRPAGVISLREALTGAERWVHEPMPSGIPYPWPKVNHMTRGMRPGLLIYLAGYTGHGKSMAAMEVAKHNAIRGVSVLFVSLEMSPQELAVRLAQGYGLDTDRYYTGRPNATDKEAMATAREFLDNCQIDVAYLRSVEEIIHVASIIEPQLVVIDYLQLLDIGKETRLEGTTKNSHALKDFARSANIPVLCLAQLRRPNHKEAITVPTVFDLKDSGAIEQDADQVIFVARKQDTDTRVPGKEGAFIVAKSRMGTTGKEDFIFDGELQRFEIIDESKVDPRVTNWNQRKDVA